jgi:hypothetical protein
MKLFFSLIFVLFGTSALASPMRWDLDNVSFDDGTSATGYIVVDPATEEILEVDLHTEAAAYPSVRRGGHYLMPASYVYDTAGVGPLGIPSLSILLQTETRVGGTTYANEFAFTLANPAPLDLAGTTSLGIDLTGEAATESSCGFQPYYGTDCIETLSAERQASGALNGYPYVPTAIYVEDNRSSFFLGGGSNGTFNNSYSPEAPFADFSERGLTSYLRSGTLYAFGGASAVSEGGSNGRSGGTFDVTFYLTAPTEITMTGRVSANNELYGRGSGEVALYSGNDIDSDNQIFRAYASTNNSDYESEDIDFTQILPAGQYRLFGEAQAYYQIGYGSFSVEATFTKAGPVGLNDADSDGDWLRDEWEVVTYGTNPNKADTDDDGFEDFEELFYGFDPLDPLDTTVDGDGDGVSDAAEIIRYRTDPEHRDSDRDWIRDGLEILTYGTNPNEPDTDGDGVFDFQELLQGTDPNTPE